MTPAAPLDDHAPMGPQQSFQKWPLATLAMLWGVASGLAAIAMVLSSLIWPPLALIAFLPLVGLSTTRSSFLCE